VFYSLRAARLEYSRISEQMVCHKTYKEQLRPTPAQGHQLAVVLWRCRTLYNTTLE
jgi:Helix-turn-helix domain